MSAATDNATALLGVFVAWLSAFRGKSFLYACCDVTRRRIKGSLIRRSSDRDH